MGCSCELKINLREEMSEKASNELKDISKDLEGELEINTSYQVDYDIQIKGKKISFNLETENNFLTSFVLQLIKSIKQFLGKNFQIGIKSTKLKNYEVEFEVEQEPKEKVEVPFVDELKTDEGNVRILFGELKKRFIQNNNVERTVNLIEEKISKQYYEGKKEYHKTIYRSDEKKPVWEKDPSKEMKERDWIKRGPGKGKWFLRAKAMAIYNTLRKIAIKEIVEPLGFREVMASNEIPADVWLKTGHLEGMPMEIYYIAEPKTRNPEEWEEFIDKAKITKEVPSEIEDLLEVTPVKGLTYAQCPIIYWSLEDETISKESLPLLVYEESQNSFRYESGGRHGMERTDEFHRIENVFIGTKEQLDELKDELIERYKHVFNQILDIEWRMSRVTPFYLQQAGKLWDEEDNKQGTIDFEAWLPFKGDRDESEWLEFQNLSIVGEKYTDAFNIKTPKNDLWSGCTGIGLDRWMVAFLAQKGLNPENWPEEFKKYFEGFPEEIKFH